MPSSPRRAVLSGLGILSPVGADLPTFWANVRAGTSGVKPVHLFDASALACRIAGEITDFDAKKIVAKDIRKSLRVMARTVQMGVCAAQRAVEDAGIRPGDLDPLRFGVEFGCIMVATEIEDLAGGARVSVAAGDPEAVDMVVWGGDGLRRVQPLWMLKYLPNMPACHVSIQHNAQGPNNTITASDAAGLLALGEAYRLLGRDLADAFLVGGAESKVNPLSLTRHNLFQPLTHRNDEPHKAVRPFDAARDGTALGEAAAVVVLEDLASAERRGSKIYAELVGYAAGFDRGRKGPVLAGVIRNALREAGVGPADVDHVNACAGGYPDLDAFEARAIHEVFGTGTPVFAPRGHVGSSGAASGLQELTASVLALHHGELPGTLNYETPDPACPVAVHTGAPRPVTKPYAVKVSYTEMGQCAAVVVRKWAG